MSIGSTTYAGGVQRSMARHDDGFLVISKNSHNTEFNYFADQQSATAHADQQAKSGNYTQIFVVQVVTAFW